MNDLSGKVAVVTGGTRGLGLAIVERLARGGADVVIASRKIDACREVAQAVANRFGVRAFPLALHVGQWDRIAAAIEEALAEVGRIDILVNNAGIAPIAPSLAEVSEGLWDKTLDVNLKGPFRLMAVVGSHMRQAGGGAIINISSVGAVRPSPSEAVYAASKSGLNALTLAFAQEYAPTVRVNCVMPGAFATDMADGWEDAFLQKVVGGLPAARLGSPQELAGMVAHLASDEAAYTTGAVIPVDGGRTAIY